MGTAQNEEIQAAFAKHYHKIADGEYKNIVVSISGGADSDRMLDFVERVGYPKDTVHYVFFDTGMEYQATKDHLAELERKYGVNILRIKAKMPVALACKKYGVPFLSKIVSEYIHRLQLHSFRWEDHPYGDLLSEYPRCKAALKWWCNQWGDGKRTNIERNKYLKDFLIAYPPSFSISSTCCRKAKKDTAHNFEKFSCADLNLQGVRKAEGGARSKITTCFTKSLYGCDTLRPLFWLKKKDCTEYDELFEINHSRCYTLYGLSRTGCACCPFGQDFEKELMAAKLYEPKLYILANAVFGQAYNYTWQYKDFIKMMEAKK